MKASILIPAYNAAEFIYQTLASCVQQGSDCVEEIIIVNDHSYDETYRIVREFQAQHADFRIILVNNPTKGACAARNHALQLARGRAIQWLDADDLLGEGKLNTQLELLQQNTQHLIASKWRRFEGDLTHLWPEEKGAWSQIPDKSTPEDWLLADRMMIPAGWLGSRQLFENLKPWNESLLINQDGEYFTRAIVASAGVIFERESRVYYRSELQGSVSQFKPHKAPSLFASIESFEKSVLTIDSTLPMSSLIGKKYYDFIALSQPNYPELQLLAKEKVKRFGVSKRLGSKNSTLYRVVLFLCGWRFTLKIKLLKKILGR